MRNLIVTLLLIAQYATTDIIPCYDLNSKLANPTLNPALCNPSAKGTKGSHSACCSITHKDACLSTGLCLASWAVNSDSFLWVEWCTDSTWQDPACARLCLNSSNLRACSSSTWCCSSDWTFSECCKNDFSLPDSGIGTVVRQLGPEATLSSENTAVLTSTSPSASGTGAQAPVCTAASSTRGSTSTAAIVGGILGAALTASLVLLIVLASSNAPAPEGFTRHSRNG